MITWTNNGHWQLHSDCGRFAINHQLDGIWHTLFEHGEQIANLGGPIGLARLKVIAQRRAEEQDGTRTRSALLPAS